MLGLNKKKAVQAQGRLKDHTPVAVIDIGSNSVRLVIYEGAVRSPAPLFNEKILCGLGSTIGKDGKLNDTAMDRAISALQRFRVIANVLEAKPVSVIATAAVREASNGDEFIVRAEKVCHTKVSVLSGHREAELAAAGVVSSIRSPDGIVGDLGGGSLELISLKGDNTSNWVSLPIGGLRLAEESNGNLLTVRRTIDKALRGVDWLDKEKGRNFYAVGGAWRALAKLHMGHYDYPLNILQQYTMRPGEVVKLSRYLQERPLEFFQGSENISKVRQETVPYGAAVMERLIRRLAPAKIIVSAFGIREGLLYELLTKKERARDPLLAACHDLSVLRSRSPKNSQELCNWTDAIFEIAQIDETEEERRLRHGAILISDIGWRVHPDYRGEQTVNIIENSAFSGIDHAGRAFMALTLYYRHVGLVKDTVSTRLKALATPRLERRARITGAALRTAHMICAGAPGVISRVKFERDGSDLIMVLPRRLVGIDGERLRRRLKVLVRELARESALAISAAKVGPPGSYN